MDTSKEPAAGELLARWDDTVRSNFGAGIWSTDKLYLALFLSAPGTPKQMYCDHIVANSNLRCAAGYIVPTWYDMDVGDGTL